jgi:hypothetical protein
MGICKLCEKKAGLFKNEHPECRKKFNDGVEKIRSLPLYYYKNKKPFSEMINEATNIANDSFINVSSIHNPLADGVCFLSDAFFDDGILTEEEEKALLEVMSIVKYDLSFLNKQIEKGKIIRKLTNGELPKVETNEQIPIIIDKKETLVYVYDNVSRYEIGQQTHYEGGSSGVSIRVMKGVYYRAGAFKGYPVKTEVLKFKSDGTLYITDKNLYFYEGLKTVKIPFNKILSITNYSDGIGIQKDGQTAKPQIFKVYDGWFLCNLIGNLLELYKSNG